FLFFFCGLGIFNGLLLAAYLLVFQQQKTTRGYWLGGLTTMFLLRVGVSCVYYFEGQIPWSVVQLGMIANVMIGPFLLAYLTSTLVVPQAVAKGTTRILLVQLLLLVVFSSLFPFTEHVYVWDTQLRYAFHTLLSLYLITALWMNWKYGPKHSRLHHQARVVTLTTIAICGGFAVSLYTNYALGPMLASLCFYGGLCCWWFGKKTTKRIPLPAADNAPAFSAFNARMLEQRLYTDANLRVTDAARATKLSVHQVTSILKSQGTTFHQYLTTLRLKEAKRLLQQQPMLTVEAIGYEAGFNARSTFFAAFKANTGMTPRAFQKQVQNSPD
ncbi:MAG: helix-turn-helix domain-containing protein, partial [Bacteroidota bacterium]